MPKNVMKLLKPSPHRARNDFDLSHRHVADVNFGEIIPISSIETVPGDNITLHASDLLRAIPFVSSPFLRAKQHLDVWFVPYHDLWHQFDAFITKKREPVSAAFKDANYCPHTTQYDLWNAINTYDSTYPDIAGRDLSDRSYYLLQLLGYGDVENYHGTGEDTYAVNPFRLAAYNYIWYNEYRQQYYDDGTRVLPNNSNAALLFNFDDLGCDTLANAKIPTSTNDQLRRLAAMTQMRYRCWKKDLFTGVLPSTQFGNVSAISVGDLTGISAAFTGTEDTVSVRTTQGYYTYSTSPSNWSNAEVSGDNTYVMTDDPGDDGYEGSHIVQDAVTDVDILGTRAGYGKMTSGSSHSRVYHTHPIDVDNLTHRHSISDIVSSGTFTPAGSVSLSGTSAGIGFDVLALRKAEAVQIWRENALRAGNRIKDNMQAHYGVASDFNDHRPTYLGSVSAPLNIGDIAVTANATTGINDTAGDIVGKGLSSLSEKVFKFHAKDFGVIMVMFSMLPEAEYDAFGIERNNQLLEAEDFFVPEYENLGLEAVSTINVGPRISGKASDNSVIGYAPRYYGYKTKLDKVFGQFTGNGVFRAWASQRSDVTSWYSEGNSQAIPLQFLYVNPALFNSNFGVSIDVSPQFLLDIYFDVAAIRPMSVIGLPFS